MSIWASQIDKLIYEKDILFIVSTGNIAGESEIQLVPGVKNYLNSGLEYPEYLLATQSRISNPSQSCLAITVGSICLNEFEDNDYQSFGKKDDPSAFTKTGPGMWGMIKPDLVEYGGDYIKEKNDNPNLVVKADTCPELVNSTLHGSKAVGQDSVGTSFAAPKVSHIIASIQKILPTESALMYRALAIQSARLPKNYFLNPDYTHMNMYGYGIPNVDRAIDNAKNRITFITSGNLPYREAHLYKILIPDELRRPGDDFDVLLEITLSFKAEPRRTRKGIKSYLSSRLDWDTSKLGELFSVFQARIVETISQDEDDNEQENNDTDRIKWMLDERNNWGRIKNIRRNNGTVQKDWTILKSNQLSEELGIAVFSRKGWSKELDKHTPYALTVSIEFLSANIAVYERIRQLNEVSIASEFEIEIQNKSE